VITVDAGQETGIGIYVFRGECAPGVLKPSEEGALEWVEVAEVLKKPLVEDLYQLLPHVLGMQSGDQPFSAHYSYDDHEKLIIRFSA
jgi:8-oxo-dGTP diphosphatase